MLSERRRGCERETRSRVESIGVHAEWSKMRGEYREKRRERSRASDRTRWWCRRTAGQPNRPYCTNRVRRYLRESRASVARQLLVTAGRWLASSESRHSLDRHVACRFNPTIKNNISVVCLSLSLCESKHSPSLLHPSSRRGICLYTVAIVFPFRPFSNYFAVSDSIARHLVQTGVRQSDQVYVKKRLYRLLS